MEPATQKALLNATRLIGKVKAHHYYAIAKVNSASPAVEISKPNRSAASKALVATLTATIPAPPLSYESDIDHNSRLLEFLQPQCKLLKAKSHCYGGRRRKVTSSSKKRAQRVNGKTRIS